MPGSLEAIIWIAVHVDDIAVTCSSEKKIHAVSLDAQFKRNIGERVHQKVLGTAFKDFDYNLHD